MENELIKRLSKGPAVLFLGQDYLQIEGKENPFLNEAARKYFPNSQKPYTYDLLLSPRPGISDEGYLSYLANYINRQTTPRWLEVVLSYQWNNIYTSAIDTLWYRNIANEWRTPVPIFEVNSRPLDPRSQVHLQCTFLYGSVDMPAEDEEKRPPLSAREKRGRRLKVSNLLNRISELVTPLGVLIVEGYNQKNDWLTLDELIPIFENLQTNQVHIFSAKQELLNDLSIQELVNEKRVVIHEESFFSFLSRALENGLLNLSPAQESGGSFRFEVHNRTLFVPSDLWSQVSRSAILIEDSLFEIPQLRGTSQRYLEFREFLAGSGSRPLWGGYTHGFNFKRDYEDELYRKVEKRIHAKELIEFPIILHGSTGTGKTIALGNLAYRLWSERKCAVLFIERKQQQPFLSDLDEFCQWAENSGSPSTVIIWDGMIDISQYSEMLQSLNSLGRKVVLIGSCYSQKPSIIKKNPEFFIKAPSEFIPEYPLFLEFLGKIDPDLSAYISRRISTPDDLFLVALYRLLPATKRTIEQNLLTEYHHVEDQIANWSKSSTIPQNSLAYAFFEAGLLNENDINLNKLIDFDGEEKTQIEKLIGLIMVPGKLGLSVPIELIMRSLGSYWQDILPKVLEEQDIFICKYDEPEFNMVIGPRHELEAEIFCKGILGNPSSEIEHAKELLNQLSSSAGIDSVEIQFAVNLLRRIGPNGKYKNYYLPCFNIIALALKKIREENGIENPRLMLQEATFYREWIRGFSASDIPENAAEYLKDLVKVLQEALKILTDKEGRYINPWLCNAILVEIGSNIAQQSLLMLNSQAAVNVNTLLKAYEQTRKVLIKAMQVNSSDFHSYDVICWLGEDLIKSGVLSEEKANEIQADVIGLFSLADPEELDVSQREQYYKRQSMLGRMIKDFKLSESAFNSLKQINPPAAYLLRANELLGKYHFSTQPTVDDLRRIEASVNYLETNYSEIKKDYRCLYFLLRYWWISKTGQFIFDQERQAINFSQEEWSYAYKISHDILLTEEGFSNLTVKFIKAVALFHMEDYNLSFGLFEELKQESFEKRSVRRIYRYIVASSANGKPIEYSGTISRVDMKNNRGLVYVSSLRRKITFFPKEFPFHDRDPKTDEPIGPFYISFNYIGPAADRIGYKKQGRLS